MVFGILTAVAACPAIIGTTEAVRHGQRQNAREEHRGRKTHLTVSLLRRSEYSQRFDGAFVVLKEKKLWVDTTGLSTRDEGLRYFLPYHNMAEVWKEAGFAKGEGMVTTISNDPPFLNWVYVDRATHEVKYGVRDEAEPHRVGPWDTTKFERRLMFEGWEGFIAVEETEGSGLWALYFDVKDDGLRGAGQVGMQDLRMLEVEIWRRELRVDRETAMVERVERIKAREETSSEETTVS
ncbi:uncharacterized protein LTR77_008392 [Saxophila tyrrhenica]|uniref:Uncharacterized protein n=1 Tax=Saxophila tyrrhenica TaxID=1690608 RepID=A0AAV9P178_9PEZI|nr:hypothetical protein LTR77_008392 [Saxophila tyrrhenica]